MERRVKYAKDMESVASHARHTRTNRLQSSETGHRPIDCWYSALSSVDFARPTSTKSPQLFGLLRSQSRSAFPACFVGAIRDMPGAVAGSGALHCRNLRLPVFCANALAPSWRMRSV